MKKIAVIIFTFFCMMLPVVGSQNKELFTVCVLLWPVVVVGLVILKIKSFSYNKINKKIYKDNKKNKKHEPTDTIED